MDKPLRKLNTRKMVFYYLAEVPAKTGTSTLSSIRRISKK